MEGIILAVLIQYVVEYRFTDAFFRILVDGYNQISSSSIYAGAVSIGESVLKTRNIEKEKI